MTRILLAVLFFVPAAVYLIAAYRKRSVFPVALTAAVFTAFFFLYSWYSLPVYAALGALFLALVISSFYDSSRQYLLTAHLICIFLACVIVRLLLNLSILSSLLSVACGFLSLFIPYVLSRKKWLGRADIIVFTSLCLTVEPLSVPFLLLTASLSGLILYGTSLISGKKTGKIAFVPLLSLSLFLVYPFQHLIMEALSLLLQ